MRILLTVHQFLPDHASGTEVIALNTAHELMRRGHDVQIFTGHPARVVLTDDQRFDQYEYAGIRVHRFLHQHMPMGNQTNLVEMDYRNDFFKQAFNAFLEREKPDVVHFIHLYRLSTTAIDACRELAIPTVFTATDFWFICPLIQMRLPDGSLCGGPNWVASNCVRHMAQVAPGSDMAARIEKIPQPLVTLGTWAIRHNLAPKKPYTDYVKAITHRLPYMKEKLNQIDRVIVPSLTMQTLLQRHGLDPKRTIHLPYGIYTDRIPRHTDKGKAPQLRVAFVGTLAEHKGCHILINAFRALPTNLPIKLTIHGKLTEFPAYVDELKTLAATDSRIEFAGPFNPPEVGGILANIDLLVCPSLWYENTPLVIYEAMAAGVPVLASNLGGMAESVKPKINGFLFEPGNVEELRQQLSALVQDRSAVGKLSSATVMPLSMSDHVTRLEAIYASLIS
jgi:glycosyltransferase involved in cell wall biosynthesis